MAEEIIRSGGNYEMSVNGIGAAGYLAMYGMREVERSVAEKDFKKEDKENE